MRMQHSYQGHWKTWFSGNMWIFTFLACLLVFQHVVPAATDDKVSESMRSTPVDYNVTCSPKWMIVSVNVNSSNSLVYLERLKGYPGCEPERLEGKTLFRLPLDNIYACGTTRVFNKLSGVRVYYHRVIIEEPQKERQLVLVSCSIPPTHNVTDPLSTRRKRNVLPEDFSEPEHINITDYIVASAPVPYLNLALRQNGRVLDTTQNVQPGTPLEMLIYLDQKSADTYGLLASYLKVTDSSPFQEEVIIMNGCSIDPYIFGNFQSLENGDLLTAKFRAFKFPEANYVLFVGTVSVCLQQCKGVPCGNGQLGFGRRKRAVPTDLPPDPNKVFEVEMTAVLKVQYAPDSFQLNKGALESGFEDKGEAKANKVTSILQNGASMVHSLQSWTLGCMVVSIMATLRINVYR